jgi:hypothetical protein
VGRGTQFFRQQVLRLLRSGQSTVALLPDILFRSVAYRIINKVETFQGFGDIPGASQLDEFAGDRNKQKVRSLGSFISSIMNRDRDRDFH